MVRISTDLRKECIGGKEERRVNPDEGNQQNSECLQVGMRKTLVGL